MRFDMSVVLSATTGTVNAEGFDSTPYERLVASFQNPFVTIFYAISVILLGMHLRHGIWSATQTLGQSNRRREKTVSAFAVVFAFAVVSAFGAFLSFPETRDVVLNHTQTVFYLVELLRDECAAIRDAADAALDVVVDEAGEKWAVHVRRARFEAHNREWLDACGGGGSFDEHSGHSEPGGRAFDARRDGGRSAPVYDDRAEEDDMYGGY